MGIIRKRKKIVLATALFLLFVLPLVSLAQGDNPDDGPGGLVPCDGPNCDFNSLLVGINKIISWFITVGAVIAALGFAWVGVIYITQGGNPSKRQEANRIFSTIAKGFFFLLASFLIVKLIITGLGTGEGDAAIQFLDF